MNITCTQNLFLKNATHKSHRKNVLLLLTGVPGTDQGVKRQSLTSNVFILSGRKK
jgi:hypothetical protein